MISSTTAYPRPAPSAVLALISIAVTLGYLFSEPFSLVPDHVAVPGIGALVVLTNLAAVLRLASADFRSQTNERRTVEILVFGWAASLHGVAVVQAVA